MTLNLRMGALVALTLLTACGGVDRTEQTRPEPMPGEIIEGSKQLEVSGVVTLDDGYARLNLDVAVDGAYAKDAKVKVAGYELPFDAEHHGYYAELSLEALPVGNELPVEVTHGEAKHTRSLTVPGAFEVEAATSAVVGSDYAVSWSRSAGANGFRVYLEPTDAFIRGGEVGALVHQYTFDQLQTVGPATLRVIAVSQNLFEGNERAKVEVVRIDRRTLTVEEQSSPAINIHRTLALPLSFE